MALGLVCNWGHYYLCCIVVDGAFDLRDLTDLQNQPPPKPRKLTEAEENQAAYLADLARFRDFTPEEDRRAWAKPIGPRWKN